MENFTLESSDDESIVITQEPSSNKNVLDGPVLDLSVKSLLQTTSDGGNESSSPIKVDSGHDEHVDKSEGQIYKPTIEDV